MSAVKHNITIEQGSHFDLDVIWNDSAGSAVDLTGYEGRMQIRETKASTATLASYTNGSEITITGASGKIEVDVGANTTANYDWDEEAGFYDLEVYDPNDATDVTRLLEGEVEFSKEVTR